MTKTMGQGLTGPRLALDFAYAFANHRPELKLGRTVSQSATRIEMMSHYMSKACETLPCPSDFHHTLPAPYVPFSLNPLYDFKF